MEINHLITQSKSPPKKGNLTSLQISTPNSQALNKKHDSKNQAHKPSIKQHSSFA
jgi:hypothetical protein